MKRENCKRVSDMKKICSKIEYTLPQGKDSTDIVLLKFVVSGKQNFYLKKIAPYYIATRTEI